MEQRLLSLIQSPSRPLHPRQLQPLHALILTSFPHLSLPFLQSPSTSRYARKVFDQMPQPNPDLCHSLISTYTNLSLHPQSLRTFSFARSRNAHLLLPSLPLVLKSCALLSALREGAQVHSYVVRRGFCCNVFVQTALIDFYCKVGDMESAGRVFEEIPGWDPVPVNCLISGYSKLGNVVEARRLFDGMERRTSASWNSMIACYAHCGDFLEALGLFERMRLENARANEITIVTVLSICAKLGDLKTGLKVREMIDGNGLQKGLILRTALLEMYVKCGAVDEARREFDQMERKDVVAWSAMIAGYAQNGKSREALELFERMKAENCKPNEVTLVGVLSACAQLGSVELGQQLGNYVESHELAYGVYVGSALLDMYSKCGNIQAALRVFDSMTERHVATWNSMIGGLAFNGFATDAIKLFEKMKDENFKPNDITFVAILTACTHTGLVELGLKFFHSMKVDHDILPKIEHCSCVVDLYCRSGRLQDAAQFISEMETEPNVAIWGALLSACRSQSNVELAELCLNKLLVLEPDNSSNYVLLSNIYADTGRWDEARKIRELMRKKKVNKVAAYSWLELDGVVHKFLVEDFSHPSIDEICCVIYGLGLQLKLAYYDDDTLELAE